MMAATVWFNISWSPIGKHSLGPSGDQNSGDVAVTLDGTKVTPANTPLAPLLETIKLGFLSRGFKL
jgi:hypothetical protein